MADRLSAVEPQPGQWDPRGFEWGYFRRLSQEAVSSLSGDLSIAAIRYGKDGALHILDAGGMRAWPPDRSSAVRTAFVDAPGEALLGRVPAGALSRDGARGAMIVGANELALFDRSSARVTRAPVIGAAIRAIALSSDGKSLLVGAGGSVELRAAAERRLRRLLPPHAGDVTACAFSENGAVAATGGEDAVVRFWDTVTGRLLEARTWEGYPVTALALSRDGALTAAVVRLTGRDEEPISRLDIWDRRTRSLLRTYPAIRGLVHRLSFSPRAETLAGGTVDGEVAFFPLARGGSPKRFIGHAGAVSSVAWSPDGKQAATSGIDGQVRLWDPSAVPATALIAAHSQSITGLSFTPDGRLLITAAMDGAVHGWDAVTLLPQSKTVAGPPVADPLRVIVDGRRIAGAEDTVIRLRAPAGDRELLLEGHGAPVRCLALSPDGRTLASGDDTRVVRLWNRATGKQVTELRSSLRGVARLAFSPSGDTLAAGGIAGRVQVWRAAPPTREAASDR
jgi:WD40 repeat protein